MMKFFIPDRTILGDFPYFFGLCFTIALGIIGYFLVRKKSELFKKRFVFCLFAFNFCLHFLKIFNSYYQQRLPEYYATITFDNICAVSAILFPFSFLMKNRVVKDYMFYMGLISGAAALIYPTGGVLNRVPYAFDYWRFYICHGIIFFGPLYMVLFGIHKLDYRRIWKVPFIFWIVLTLIFINTILLAELGITEIRNTNFLEPGYVRNASLVFGPTLEFRTAVEKVLLFLVPDFLKIVPFGPYKGQFKCCPLLWLFIPSYVYLCIVAFILSIPFEYKKMKSDFVLIKEKISTLISTMKNKKKAVATDKDVMEEIINSDDEKIENIEK